MRSMLLAIGLCVISLSIPRLLSAQRQQSPIFVAAAAGDVKAVGELLASDPKLANALGTFRETPLHVAIKNSHREVVALLLEKGANVNAPGMRDGTPLVLAAKGGRIEIVELLLESGASLNPAEHDREASALSVAARAGNKSIVELLLKKGAATNVKGRTVSTALIGAVENGNLGIVELLLQHGADANIADPYFGSPFDIALRLGNLAIARALLPRLADPQKALGTPPIAAEQLTDAKVVEERLSRLAVAYRDFHAAGAAGNLPAVRESLELCPRLVNAPAKRYGARPLLLAVESGNAELVEYLVDQGAEVEHDTSDGTALDRAIKLGRLEVVKILVAKGARLNAERVGARDLPLSLAVSGGDKPIIEYLLQQGAAVNGVAWPGETALNVAVQRGNVEVARLLLDQGANVKGGERGNPLATAAALGNVEMVELLLDRGAVNDVAAMQAASRAKKQDVVDVLLRRGGRVDIVALISQGDTTRVAELLKADPKVIRQVTTSGSLLHLAVSQEDEAMTQLLLAQGASADSRNSRRQTPLHLAAEKGHIDMVSILLKGKAQVNPRDDDGQTPWDLARSDVVKEILANHGGKSGRTVGEGETVAGSSRRAKPLTGPSITFGQWSMYPRARYLFKTDEFRLVVRNDDGKMFRECEIGPVNDCSRVTFDPAKGVAVTVTEKRDGKEQATQFKDEAEFQKLMPDKSKRLAELMLKLEQKELDGDWEFRGPGTTTSPLESSPNGSGVLRN